MCTMEKFAVYFRYITQTYKITIYLLCKNADIRNWFGKHLRANEKIFFLNIIAWQCPFCECNSNFFQNQENKYKKNHFSKNDVEQSLQCQMLTNLVFPYSN